MPYLSRFRLMPTGTEVHAGQHERELGRERWEFNMTDKDQEFIRQAIDASKNCRLEPGKPTPKVGAVVARDGTALAIAWRGRVILSVALAGAVSRPSMANNLPSARRMRIKQPPPRPE